MSASSRRISPVTGNPRGGTFRLNAATVALFWRWLKGRRV